MMRPFFGLFLGVVVSFGVTIAVAITTYNLVESGYLVNAHRFMTLVGSPLIGIATGFVVGLIVQNPKYAALLGVFAMIPLFLRGSLVGFEPGRAAIMGRALGALQLLVWAGLAAGTTSLLFRSRARR